MSCNHSVPVFGCRDCKAKAFPVTQRFPFEALIEEQFERVFNTIEEAKDSILNRLEETDNGKDCSKT